MFVRKFATIAVLSAASVVPATALGAAEASRAGQSSREYRVTGFTPDRVADPIGQSALALAEESVPMAIKWSRDQNDPHWVQGQVNVMAPPDAVWARISDIPNWPKLFTDVKWLKVLETGKDRWRVRLETRTFSCGSHEYNIALNGGHTLSFEIDAPGIDSKARVLVRPGASASQSNVVYSLYVRATGIVGWFISEKQLRSKQEQMVLRALGDIERTFGAATVR